MKRSIRKPRKASWYLALAGIFIAAGVTTLIAGIIEENNKVAEEASSYDHLMEEVQQDQRTSDPSFPKADDWDKEIDRILDSLDQAEDDSDDPQYRQTHPPDWYEQPGSEPRDVREELIIPSLTEKPDDAQHPTAQPHTAAKPQENKDATQHHTENVQVPADDTSPSPSPTPIIGNTGADLAACKAKNNDFIAWLTIPGTRVNYPVVLTNDTEFYLTHDFNRKKNKLGTLFSLGKTDYQTPGKNISIYGHHITNTSNGQLMFRPLLSYKQKDFYESHSTIYLDSLYHIGTYKIFAVVNVVKDEWDASTTAFANDADFLAFVRQAQSQSLYNTGVEVTSDDRILTLITCDRSFASADGRLIVMAVEQ